MSDDNTGSSRKTSSDYKFPGIKIGLIIPAYNEEKNIKTTLERIPNNLSERLEIIVIDDGSFDETAKLCRNYGITVLSHEINMGNGAAVTTGIYYCRDNKFDVAITMDADGQHDPFYLDYFIKAILYDGIDFAIGNRFKYYYDMKSTKKIASKLLTAFYAIFLGKKIGDPTNGYRALSRKLMQEIQYESHYSITQEQLLKIIPGNHYKFIEIPVKVRQRIHGRSFIRLKNYLRNMVLFFIKYYLFPKFRKLTERVFKPNIRRRVGKYLLKT